MSQSDYKKKIRLKVAQNAPSEFQRKSPTLLVNLNAIFIYFWIFLSQLLDGFMVMDQRRALVSISFFTRIKHCIIIWSADWKKSFHRIFIRLPKNMSNTLININWVNQGDSSSYEIQLSQSCRTSIRNISANRNKLNLSTNNFQTCLSYCIKDDGGTSSNTRPKTKRDAEKTYLRNEILNGRMAK